MLVVHGLQTCFDTPHGRVFAVDEVDLAVAPGETLGVVGESGCGKTVLALSIMRLVSKPAGRIIAGRIMLGGRDLLSLDEHSMRMVRGRDIAMIFQEPMNALNPVFRIGDQIAEVITLHGKASKKQALKQAVELLGSVGIAAAEKRVMDYPHQLSGGMRQRVMIAMALACRPQLIIADEPTTALDVTIQAQILGLLEQLQKDTGTAVMLITHDLAVIAETSHRVAVMYAGEIVESAPVDELFVRPRHPYTIGLMHSIPPVNASYGRDVRLKTIRGYVPSLIGRPPGCRFHDRCPRAEEQCRREKQLLLDRGEGHFVRCWKA